MADDRGKLSFSERDKRQRERKHGGGGHEERRPGQRKLEHSQAYSSYKQQLNKLFDGGGALPEALQEKLAETGVGKVQAERKRAADAIRAAQSGAAKLKALGAYRAAYEGEMPADEEALQGFLQVSEELEQQPDLLCEVISSLEAMHVAGDLKRLATLKARLKNTRMMVDDDDVDAAATALLKRL